MERSKKLGSASSAVAPLQAGSVAVAHTHRSVRGLSLHGTGALGYGGYPETDRFSVFFSLPQNSTWFFLLLCFSCICVVSALNWCWCVVLHLICHHEYFAVWLFWTFKSKHYFISSQRGTWRHLNYQQMPKTWPKVYMMLSHFWTFLYFCSFKNSIFKKKKKLTLIYIINHLFHTSHPQIMLIAHHRTQNLLFQYLRWSYCINFHHKESCLQNH